MAISDEFKCTLCGSTDQCFGYLATPANVFIPTGIFTFHGFKSRSYVCLKCGHITNYIPPDKLARLREKFINREELQ
jgi:DNA-directed RNA polymerase subunit RPC12/RpoP